MSYNFPKSMLPDNPTSPDRTFDHRRKVFDMRQNLFDDGQNIFDSGQNIFDNRQKRFDACQKFLDDCRNTFDSGQNIFDGSQKLFDVRQSAFDSRQKSFDARRTLSGTGQNTFEIVGGSSTIHTASPTRFYGRYSMGSFVGWALPTTDPCSLSTVGNARPTGPSTMGFACYVATVG